MAVEAEDVGGGQPGQRLADGEPVAAGGVSSPGSGGRPVSANARSTAWYTARGPAASPARFMAPPAASKLTVPTGVPPFCSVMVGLRERLSERLHRWRASGDVPCRVPV